MKTTGPKIYRFTFFEQNHTDDLFTTETVEGHLDIPAKSLQHAVSLFRRRYPCKYIIEIWYSIPVDVKNRITEWRTKPGGQRVDAVNSKSE